VVGTTRRRRASMVFPDPGEPTRRLLCGFTLHKSLFPGSKLKLDNISFQLNSQYHWIIKREISVKT